jgi:hypothetical protein
MVTAEIAAALPALVLVLTLGLGAVAAVTDHLRCVDAARTGARLLARGETVDQVRPEVARRAPDDARISLEVGDDTIEVEVSADPPRVLSAVGVRTRPRGVAHALREAVS